MAHKFPKDRYDSLPHDFERVGAHRGPHRKGRAWIGFAWAALATLVLVALGAIGIFTINGTLDNGLLPFARPSATGSETPSEAPSPTPSVTPTVDPSLTVIVLNGTDVQGLAGEVTDSLQQAGWNTGEPANASQTDVSQTVVYYSDPANEGAALGAAETLKQKALNVTVQLTENFVDSGADLTVVVGTDYGAAS